MQEWISSPIGMHPVESGQWVLAADATAERDRLRKDLNDIGEDYHRLAASLAAANATLDRLREVVPKRLADTHIIAAGELKHILYPPETTSIRDTAAAHGFDPMPADIAQRSVDGETNYVRLNPEDVG